MHLADCHPGRLCFSFVMLGLISSILGPTLLDLGIQTNSTTQTMSYVFTSRTSGYLVGSIIGGFVVDRVTGRNLYLAMVFIIAFIGFSKGGSCWLISSSAHYYCFPTCDVLLWPAHQYPAQLRFLSQPARTSAPWRRSSSRKASLSVWAFLGVSSYRRLTQHRHAGQRREHPPAAVLVN